MSQGRRTPDRWLSSPRAPARLHASRLTIHPEFPVGIEPRRSVPRCSILNLQSSISVPPDEIGELLDAEVVRLDLQQAADGRVVVVGDGAEVHLPAAAGAVGEQGVAG